jgi:DivIVA domain-containing protein
MSEREHGNDEGFHLTPLDVRRFPFSRAMRGYEPARVEEFREQVANELERLTRLNQDLEARAKGFHEQLKSFRERDKALNDALISAQQLRAEIREQAEREAQLILREARAEAERLVEATRSDIRSLTEQLQALERTRRAYLAQLRSLVERQLAQIEAAEQAIPPQQAPSEGQRSPGPHHTPAWLDSLMKE